MSSLPPLETTRHASAVALYFPGSDEGFGVLIDGESGGGKSSLVLDMLMLGSCRALGLSQARLVGDDQVVLNARDGRLFAAGARRLSGLVEVRGLGLLRLEPLAQVPVGLRVLLCEEADRLPQPSELQTEIEGVHLPSLPLSRQENRAQCAVLAASALSRGYALADFSTSGVPFSF